MPINPETESNNGCAFHDIIQKISHRPENQRKCKGGHTRFELYLVFGITIDVKVSCMSDFYFRANLGYAYPNFGSLNFDK